MDNKEPGRRSRIITVVLVILAIFLIAKAVDVTQVDFTEPLEPTRQQNLVELLRKLARPTLVEYENETRSLKVSLLMPCPEEVKGTQVTAEGRQVTMIPNCVSTTQDVLQMTGEGFNPNAQIVLRWQPNDAPSSRTLATFKADDQGSFAVDFTMPDIRESDRPQTIEVVEGISRRISAISSTTVETWQRIIQTILMALMASTLGTIIAVPISFVGARNIMRDLGMPLGSVMAAIIAIPIGFGLGYLVSRALLRLAGKADGSAWISLLFFMVAAGLVALLVRVGLALLQDESQPLGTRIVNAVGLLLTIALSLLALAFLAQFGLVFGGDVMGVTSLGFFSDWVIIPIGNFIYVLSDVFLVLSPFAAGFVLAIVCASYASRFGQEAILRLSENSARLLTVFVTIIGCAFLVFALLYVLWWINLFGFQDKLAEADAFRTLGPVALGAGLLLGLLSVLARPKRQYPVGIVTYFLTRTILNTMRAIEPLFLGLVFVIWVGIGPFAGVLALIIHSVADLGKLFSEQVENIDEGPVEAITATGANRIQIINFAVIPQIVPHYIAFIFYRWDINVRMSTIIGFVGGGGIGLILQLRINTLRYSEAAVMIIAIALVVMILDNVSSRIRRRII